MRKAVAPPSTSSNRSLERGVWRGRIVEETAKIQSALPLLREGMVGARNEINETELHVAVAKCIYVSI